MQNIFRNIAAVWMFIGGNVMFADGNPATDMERIRQASDSLMVHLIEEAGISSASSIFVSYDNKIAYTVLYYSIIESFFSKNISITTDSTNRDMMLEISLRGSAISYSETFSESFLGALKTTRTISLTYDGIMRNRQKVFWAGSKTISLVDTVNYSDLDNLHSGDLPFASYSKPALSIFDSLLEPVVVTIASGVAIYLFFTIRS